MTAEPPTDEFLPTRRSLLSRLRNWQDGDGWREFLDRYGRFIFSVARRAGLRAEEAEDVVQETLLSVAKKMPDFRYDERGSFKAWLMAVVRGRISDLLRKKNRRIPEGGGMETAEEEAGVLPHETVWEEIGVGMGHCCPTPPSEPDGRISRIRLSG